MHHDTLADRFRFTTFRWANQLNGNGEYAKRPLMRKGFAYADFTCGTDTPEQWRPFSPAGQPVQIGLICSPQLWLLVVDVDHPGEYEGTATAALLGRDDAMSTRGDGFHAGLDMRGIPPARWPRQGKIPGADIKAAGFVPLPGAVHWSGELYAPGRVTADGLPGLVPVTEDILAALAADRGAFSAGPGRGGGGPGGGPVNGMDHDSARASVVMSGVLRKRPLEAIYADWLAMPDHGPACHSSSGFTDADFWRHHDGAVRKEARMAGEQAAWFGRSMRRALS